jgi:hypothetical protein
MGEGAGRPRGAEAHREPARKPGRDIGAEFVVGLGT